MKITKLAKTTLAVSLLAITGLTSTLILATNTNDVSNTTMNLKQELDQYRIDNNSGMTGNDKFYTKFKTNREAMIENDCISSVSKICIELKNERVELKEDYKFYHIGSYTKLKIFYTAQIEKDGVFTDIKEQAASYLANKTLNEDFHNKAEAIVYSL